MEPINPFKNGMIALKPVENDLKTTKDSFSRRLKEAVLDVNTKQNVADDSIEQVLQGKLGIHEGMMALTEADISMRVMLQVRNKVIDAYREIMRMPL